MDTSTFTDTAGVVKVVVRCDFAFVQARLPCSLRDFTTAWTAQRKDASTCLCGLEMSLAPAGSAVSCGTCSGTLHPFCAGTGFVPKCDVCALMSKVVSHPSYIILGGRYEVHTQQPSQIGSAVSAKQDISNGLHFLLYDQATCTETSRTISECALIDPNLMVLAVYATKNKEKGDGLYVAVMDMTSNELAILPFDDAPADVADTKRVAAAKEKGLKTIMTTQLLGELKKLMYRTHGTESRVLSSELAPGRQAVESPGNGRVRATRSKNTNVNEGKEDHLAQEGAINSTPEPDTSIASATPKTEKESKAAAERKRKAAERV